QQVLSSVGDDLTEVPTVFKVDAKDEANRVIAISHEANKLFGLQFYPEVKDSEFGIDVLKNFLFEISHCKGDWSVMAFIDQEIAKIREEAGDKKVLCALSGGVDSSVVAALIHKAIGDQLTCIFVDHGLLRKNEVEDVMSSLKDDFHMNIIQIDAS